MKLALRARSSYKKITAISAAFVLMVSGLTALLSFTVPRTVEALGAVSITNVSELRDAIENQADGQIWTIQAGNYGLTPFTTITAGGQTGWYFPITANNITINGVGNPTIYGTGYTPNGNLATQNLVTVFGDNVTIDGFTFMPKVQPNKTLEVHGADFTLRNTTFTPNTLDVTAYASIVDPGDREEYKQWGGSLYFSHEGNHVVQNVTIKNAGVSFRYAPVGTQITFTNVVVENTTNVDWINGYRFSSGFNNASNTTVGLPTVEYHVNATLNNLGSVLNAVQDDDTIVFDSDLTVSEQLTLEKAVTVEGNGHTLTGDFVKTDNGNNSVLALYGDNITVNDLTVDAVTSANQLHAINTYEVTGIELNDVTVKNARTGVNVNRSTVTVNNIHTMNNAWHGIDVDKTGAHLTVNGVSHHDEVMPDIYIDDTTIGQVTDTNNQYGTVENVLKAGDRVYKLKLAGPVLTYPANSQVIPTNNFDFDWEDVAGASSYEFQNSKTSGVNPDGSLSAVHYSATSPTSQLHSSGAPDGTVRYWQVRAVDAYGIKGEWSNVWKMAIDMTAPVASITSPSNGAYVNGVVSVSGTVTDTNPMNSYFRITGPSGYVKTSLYTDGRTTHSFNWDTTSLADGAYTIQFETRDQAGNKNAGSVTSIVVYIDRTGPVAPELVSPSDGASVNGGPVLKWQTSTPSDVDHYVYQSFSDASLNTLVYQTNVNGTQRTVGGTQNITIWWRVAAVDAQGNQGDWSSAWMLVIDNTAPVVTVDSQTTTSTTPTITGTIDDPTANVVVTVNGFNYVATNNGDGTWSAVVTDTLTTGVYTVSAAAIDSAGNITFPESTNSLTVNSAPVPLVRTLTPAANNIPANANTPTLPQNAAGGQAQAGAQVLGTTTTNEVAATGEVEGVSTERTFAQAADSDVSTEDAGFMGLAWYWWLLILAAVATILWWIIAAIRGRQAPGQDI